MLDALIIGAGPGGLSCAIYLALNGIKVDIFEKDECLKDKVCGDGLSIVCMEELEKLNISLYDLLSIGANKIIRKFEIIQSRYFETKYPRDCLGLSRPKLISYLYRKAISLGVKLHFGINVKQIVKNDDYYLINQVVKCKNLVLACGITSSLIDNKPDDLPLGISSRVYAKSEKLHNDAFYFKYAETYGNGYAWVFPIGENLWNIGVFNSDKKSSLKKIYQDFEDILFKEYMTFEKYDRKPGGAFIGASQKGVLINENAIGDAAYKALHSSGEGITFAIRTGIEKAKEILKGY